MKDAELYFKGGFSPGWLDDNIPKIEIKQPAQYTRQNKNLDTLLNELEEIKEHLQNVRERQWNLAKSLQFHNAGFAKN